MNATELIEQIREQMSAQAERYRHRDDYFAAVATHTGLNQHSVSRFFYGRYFNPTRKIVDAFASAVERMEKVRGPFQD